VHFKKIPLCIAVSPVIVLQEEIILVVSNFHDASQVSGLKSRFKHQCVVCRLLQFVVWGEVLVVSV
jgi:hypothetical protein